MKTAKDLAYEKIVQLSVSSEGIEEVASQRGYFQPRILSYLEENNLAFCKGLDFITDPVFFKELTKLGWASGLGFTLNSRVVIPIRDVQGHVVTLVGWKRGSSKYYTIADKDFSKESHWFNLDRALDKSFSKGSVLPKCVVVVEGIFDALHLDAYGIPAVATMGSDINDFKGSLLEVFDKVICMPDNDKVGRNALLKGRWSVPSSASFVYFKEKRMELAEEVFYKVKDIDNVLSLYGEGILPMLQEVAKTPSRTVHEFKL